MPNAAACLCGGSRCSTPPAGDLGKPVAVAAEALGVVAAQILDATDDQRVGFLDTLKADAAGKRQVFLGRVDDCNKWPFSQRRRKTRRQHLFRRAVPENPKPDQLRRARQWFERGKPVFVASAECSIISATRLNAARPLIGAMPVLSKVSRSPPRTKRLARATRSRSARSRWSAKSRRVDTRPSCIPSSVTRRATATRSALPPIRLANVEALRLGAFPPVDAGGGIAGLILAELPECSPWPTRRRPCTPALRSSRRARRRQEGRQ